MIYFTYPVKLTRDRKDGGYVASCRDIPKAITPGNTVEDALREAEGALQAAIECRLEDGLDIPVPSPAKRGECMVPTPTTTALKAAVYTEIRGQQVSKLELARRMNVNEKEANRLPVWSAELPWLIACACRVVFLAQHAVNWHKSPKPA